MGVAFGVSYREGWWSVSPETHIGQPPASTNTMILEVSALRGVLSRCACGSSAGDVFSEMSSALEQDAHRERTPRKAETSRIVAFVLAECGPNFDITARWPPPFPVGRVKRYTRRGVDPLECLQRV